MFRYKAETAKFPTPETVQELLDVFHVDSFTIPTTDLEKVSEQFLANVRTSPWREELTSDGRDRNVGDRKEGAERKSAVLNLRRFAENRGLLVGKNGYDRNLNLVNGEFESVGMHVCDHHLCRHKDKTGS